MYQPLPQEYKLIQNRPNPFVTSTLIKYQVPEPASVKLRIYNARGQLVGSFIQQHNATGYYALEWEAGNLSPGVYLVSMETEGYYEVKKLLKIDGK
jgi:hypothetical protein